MGSADEIDVLLFQKFGDYIRAEDETYASFILVPALHTFLRVGPEQVTEESLIRDFNWPYYFEYLL